MIPQDGYPQKNNKHWWWCRNSSYTAAAKSLQSCPTLWDPIDLGSPPGSPVLQARTLEWVAISFSNACKWKVKAKSLSCVRPLAWTAAYQAPPSMGFNETATLENSLVASQNLNYKVTIWHSGFTLVYTPKRTEKQTSTQKLLCESLFLTAKNGNNQNALKLKNR